MNHNYAVGDYIVDSSCVHVITAIKQQKGPSGQAETYLFYEPVLGSDKRYVASIPVKNLEKSGTRKVLTVKEAEKLMADLANKSIDGEYDTVMAREEVYRNEPERIVKVLKYFWKNKDELTKTDANLTEEILEHLCREIAFVTNKKTLAVKETMMKTLGGAC